MKTRLLVVVALCASSVATAQAPRATDRLSWLTGCWERRTPSGVVEEHWSPVTGGMLLGFSRTVRRDTVVAYEFLRVFAVGDTLVYEAQPSRQARTEFCAVPPFGAEIVFTNSAHDFPQRVVYARRGDSLLARIEGTRDGQERVVRFPYVRSTC